MLRKINLIILFFYYLELDFRLTIVLQLSRRFNRCSLTTLTSGISEAVRTKIARKKEEAMTLAIKTKTYKEEAIKKKNDREEGEQIAYETHKKKQKSQQSKNLKKRHIEDAEEEEEEEEEEASSSSKRHKKMARNEISRT